MNKATNILWSQVVDNVGQDEMTFGVKRNKLWWGLETYTNSLETI